MYLNRSDSMQITLNDAQKYIEQANDFEINEIMEAVRLRFAVAFPDWEVIYLSCPKNDPVQRRKTLEALVTYLDT